MDRGFYTSVAGMMCGNKKLGDIANNIANISTIGYKKDLSMITEFSDLVINKMDENVNVGNLTNQVNIAETYTLYGQGSMVQTTLPNDYAITGDGFFKIDKDGDYVYTRDGSFKVDVDGYLVTSKGYYVMDKNNSRILSGNRTLDFFRLLLEFKLVGFAFFLDCIRNLFVFFANKFQSLINIF